MIDPARADARNALNSLALRAETHHPATAAALLDCRRPVLEEGVLTLTYGPEKPASMRLVVRALNDLRAYTDCELHVHAAE